MLITSGGLPALIWVASLSKYPVVGEPSKVTWIFGNSELNLSTTWLRNLSFVGSP